MNAIIRKIVDVVESQKRFKFVKEDRESHGTIVQGSRLFFTDGKCQFNMFIPNGIAELRIQDYINLLNEEYYRICILVPKVETPLKLGKYKHYKGNSYQVLMEGTNSENLQPMVVYKALYGDGKVWVRPKFMFLERVRIGDDKYVDRFEFLE